MAFIGRSKDAFSHVPTLERAMRSIRWRTIIIAVLALTSLFALFPRNVKQRVYDRSTGLMRDTSMLRVPINLGLDLRGGVHLALEPDQSQGAIADCRDAILRAERVVRARLDELGTSEPVVQVAGECRLVVEIPGVHDLARARSIVERSAFLEFRIVDATGQLNRALPSLDAAARISHLLHPGDIQGEFFVPEAHVGEVERLLALPEVQQHLPRGIELRWAAQTHTWEGAPARALYALDARSTITGDELQDATAAIDPTTGGAIVQFELLNVASRKFGDMTGRNIGHHLAIVLDGRVQGRPPVITERITQRGQIKMGGKTIAEAHDLALVLRAGALPVPLHVVEQQMIGPSLGSDSIQDGIRTSAFAVAFVLLVLGVYYGISGLLAVGALILYVLFSLGGLAVLGSTLTLPGLAGFALSIGMAVDANVLIFERIREELAAGKTVRTAVNEGFRHAMSAIVDSNVTTALTAAILYMVGTGPVRGFAVTLLLGLLASMLSAVFATRTFFLIWLQRRPAMTTLHSFRLRMFANAKYEFIRMRRWALMATAAFVIPGLIMLGASGITYSIEFTGGAMIHIRTEQPSATASVREALSQGGIGAAEIQNFGSDRDFLIRTRLEGGKTDASAVTTVVRQALDNGLGSGAYDVVRTEDVGPKVGAELQRKALIAVLFSFVTTLIYLAFRFEWRFGLAAVIATAHDIIATVAFIRYLDLEVSLVVVAAVLTVLGYSLNDTIVIFDRVRENLAKSRRVGFVDLLNKSINETLPRTILTGGTTLATALMLSFFAGEVIKPFALVMSFGIVVGTLSSIFVASPVLLWIENRWTAKKEARAAGPARAPA